MRWQQLSLATLLFCGALSAASAAPLTYDESVGGDLNENLFLLDVGTNSVSGSTFFTSNPEDFDSDLFQFIVPAGQALESITLTVEEFTPIGTVSDPFLTLGLLVNSIAISESFTLEVLNPSEHFSGHLPLSPGSYWINENSGGATGSDTETYGFSYSYQWAFDVSGPLAVPEPASVTLFGLGLIGLGLVWRRRPG